MSHTDKIPDLDFRDLLDVPDDFVGFGKFVVIVEAGETGLDFAEYVPANFLLDKELAAVVPTDGQVLVFDSTLDKWDVTALPEGVHDAEWLQGIPITTDTPVDGDILRYDSTSGEWETYQILVGAEHSCKAHLTTDQSITKSVWTALSFGATVWDTQDYWVAGSPTRMTIPTGHGGRYSVRTNSIWEQLTQDASTQARLYKNGVAVTASHSGQYVNKAAGDVWLPTNNQIIFDIELEAGDYLEFFVWVSVGVGASVDALGNSDPLYASWMSLERIE